MLQFIGNEEGRARPKDNGFVFDYFIKDHLGNTRMVLTDEQQTDAYPVASMETATAASEKLYYSNIDETRADKPAGYPSDTYTNPNDKVARLNGSNSNSKKIGPAILLKVMSGDQMNIRANAYYRLNGASAGTPSNPASELLAALAGSIQGVTSGKFGLQQVQSSGVLGPGISDLLQRQTDQYTGSTRPKAFLNWVLLDEQFKIVKTSTGFEPVGADGEFKTFVKTGLPISQNGYLYVYTSNESPVDVFFDNLQVTHVRGPLLEETHYYPFGLTMSGISSKATNTLQNKLLYNSKELQSKEFTDGSGLELYDYDARMQDPQLGRFWQSDPLAEKHHFSSPYCYVDNNPIHRIDPDGRDWIISMREVKGRTVMYITMNGKVYNNSSSSYSKDDMEKFKNQMAFQIRTAFGQDNENLQVNISVNLSVANNIDDIEKTDHVFQIVDDGKVVNGIADAPLGGLNIRIEKTLAEQVINGDNTRTVPHELGHTGQLNHPHGASLGSDNPDKSGYSDVPLSQRGQNLMSQSWYVSRSGNPLGNARQVTKDQYKYMYNQYQNGNLNQNSPVKTEWILVPSGMPIAMPVKVKYLENKTQ